MKAVWTPLGLKSLEAATSFIEEQWGEAVANTFLDQFDKRIEQLKRATHIGPTYEQTKFRQLLIHPLVTLYYELKTNQISVVLVWANKQDPEELRKRLKQV